MDLHFGCTQCGRCCRDLKLPLSLDEALAWTAAGHAVELMIEALPEPEDGERADYDRARSYPVMSGTMPMRIAIIAVAWHQGPCPWLTADMRCGQYATRPRVCRIYPLMARPFETLDPAERLCPPEAWDRDAPLLQQGETIADPQLAQVVAAHRAAASDDVAALMAAAALLGWTRAGFANEGFAVLRVTAADLHAALLRARRGEAREAIAQQWTLVTNRKSTLDLLRSVGVNAELVDDPEEYRGSFAPQ